jgi:hypothetical protein
MANGLNMLQSSGGGFGFSRVVTQGPSPAAAPAAVVAYGPGATAVTNAGPGVVNSSPGSVAIYIGAGALLLLVLARQSHADKRDFDQDIITIILTSLALRGAVINAQRRVLEGKTSGATGTVNEAVSLL